MPEGLTPEQEARFAEEVEPLERAAYQHEQAGEREESFRLRREALVREEAIVGPVDEALADAFQIVGNDLYHDGQHEEAEGLYLRALSIYETLYGQQHLEVADALTWLGYLYDDWERYEMSVPIYCRALAIEEHFHGKGSPEAATTCIWLGDAHQALGQYAEAEAYLQRGLHIWQVRRAIDDGWKLTITQERLAGVLFHLKRYGDALVAYQDVLALNQGKFKWKNSRRRFNRCWVKCLPAMEAVMQGG